MITDHPTLTPRIASLREKKLVGRRKQMSFAANTTRELWESFMPRRKEILNTVGTSLFSVERYNNTTFFANFDPTAPFEKWAAVEVTDHQHIPPEMEALTLPAGPYAVFIHRGPASEGQRTYEYIFKKWLPQSGFNLDNRPHFALMGERYKNNDPDSEEEIWIPIISY